MIVAGLLLFAAPAYSYWIAPCAPTQAECQAQDITLAQWAFEAWQNAADGRLHLTRANDSKHAPIQLIWAGAREGLYGEARPIVVDGQAGAQVFVRPAPLNPADPLLRDAIVYLTCLHETGHALGLAHTAGFADIMYSFQFGGDIPEYFGRYRRKLRVRDDIRKNSGISSQDRQRLIELLSK